MSFGTIVKMRFGSMPKCGDIVLAKLQFTDTFEIKLRPALILFSENDNYVVAGITSDTSLVGIPLTRKEGAVKEKDLVYDELISKLGRLKQGCLHVPFFDIFFLLDDMSIQ